MTRNEKIQAAKRHIGAKIADIIEKNYNEGGSALESVGTFTSLIEAYRACEIAEEAVEKEVEQEKRDKYIAGMKSL